MEYTVIYTLHTGSMMPGENEVHIYRDKTEALSWFAHEKENIVRCYGKAYEVYHDFVVSEVRIKALEEVGPQTIAEYYAEHGEGSTLVRLEAHIIFNPIVK